MGKDPPDAKRRRALAMVSWASWLVPLGLVPMAIHRGPLVLLAGQVPGVLLTAGFVAVWAGVLLLQLACTMLMLHGRGRERWLAGLGCVLLLLVLMGARPIAEFLLGWS